MRHPEFDTALADDKIDEDVVKEYAPDYATARIMTLYPHHVKSMATEKDEQRVSKDEHPPPFLTTDSCTFITTKKSPKLTQSFRINNMPPLAVGLLGLANSADFAANVFDQTPIPTYATILMIVGATCALFMSCIALSDAIRSWKNIKLLRQERHMLLAQDEESGAASAHSLFAVELDLNHHNFWTDIFHRGGMDVLLGTAAFLVAAGSYMASAGANPNVFRASNLLSGYIGNAPVAAYGLATAAWSIHVWLRAHGQSCAAKAGLEDGVILAAITRRIVVVKAHAVMNGVICLISGVLSMFTPTRWWPYPVLVVCGVAFLYTTHVYRTHIGYTRPQILPGVRMDKDVLVRELNFTTSMRIVLQDVTSGKTSIDMASLSSLLATIVRCDLFESLSRSLMQDPIFSKMWVMGQGEEIHLTPSVLSSLPAKHHARICEIARACLQKRGLKHLLHRERFLLEALASSLAVPYRHSGSIQQSNS